MQISLNKDSDVPLHEQLAEQLVFLITTRKLQRGEQLPSVRSFARRLGIHHNTVSKSYRDLVSRGWVKRQPGSRLSVGTPGAVRRRAGSLDLDELINHTILRASELGYSLQALRTQVLDRLRAQPPDHILVVEPELELRRVMCAEISSRVGDGGRVESCTAEELSNDTELLLGAQVVAPEHLVHTIEPLLAPNLPCISLKFAGAENHLALIRALSEPSVIGVASISKTFLKTARSLLAPLVGRHHSMNTLLLTSDRRRTLDGFDVVFCDSVATSMVRCRGKVHYRLVSEECLEDIAVSLTPPMESRGKI